MYATDEGILVLAVNQDNVAEVLSDKIMPFGTARSSCRKYVDNALMKRERQTWD